MSMQYFSQRYLTATGGSILVEGDTPICRSSSWSESNHRRKVGSDTPAACANSDLSFDLYAIFLLVLLFLMSCTRALCARESFVHSPIYYPGPKQENGGSLALCIHHQKRDEALCKCSASRRKNRNVIYFTCAP